VVVPLPPQPFRLRSIAPPQSPKIEMDNSAGRFIEMTSAKRRNSSSPDKRSRNYMAAGKRTGLWPDWKNRGDAATRP
jgi:hypothetical protein